MSYLFFLRVKNYGIDVLHPKLKDFTILSLKFRFQIWLTRTTFQSELIILKLNIHSRSSYLMIVVWSLICLAIFSLTKFWSCSQIQWLAFDLSYELNLFLTMLLLIHFLNPAISFLKAPLSFILISFWFYSQTLSLNVYLSFWLNLYAEGFKLSLNLIQLIYSPKVLRVSISVLVLFFLHRL